MLHYYNSSFSGATPFLKFPYRNEHRVILSSIMNCGCIWVCWCVCKRIKEHIREWKGNGYSSVYNFTSFHFLLTWRRCIERLQYWACGTYRIPYNEHGHRSFNAQTFMFQDFYKKHIDFTYSDVQALAPPSNLRKGLLYHFWTEWNHPKKSCISCVYRASCNPKYWVHSVKSSEEFSYIWFFSCLLIIWVTFLRLSFLQVKAKNVP